MSPTRSWRVSIAPLHLGGTILLRLRFKGLAEHTACDQKQTSPSRENPEGRHSSGCVQRGCYSHHLYFTPKPRRCQFEQPPSLHAPLLLRRPPSADSETPPISAPLRRPAVNHMRVNLLGRSNRAVPQARGHRRQWYTARQQVRAVRVPQRVQTRALGQLRPATAATRPRGARSPVRAFSPECGIAGHKPTPGSPPVRASRTVSEWLTIRTTRAVVPSRSGNRPAHGDKIITGSFTAIRGRLRAADFALSCSGDLSCRIHVIVLARDRGTSCRPKTLTSPFHYC